MQFVLSCLFILGDTFVYVTVVVLCEICFDCLVRKSDDFIFIHESVF